MAQKPIDFSSLDLNQDFANPPPRPKSLIGGHFVERNLNVVAGQPGSYKTMVLLEIASAIAIGRQAFGLFPTKASPVTFITGDDPREVLIDRLLMLNCVIDDTTKQRVLPADIARKLAKNLRVIPLDRVVTPLNPQMFDAIRRSIEGSSFAVLDPLRHFIGNADENKADEIYEQMVPYRQLATEYETAISIIHHAKKSTSDDDEMNDFRGSGAIRGLSRAMVSIKRANPGASPPRINIVSENRYNEEPENVVLDLEKITAPNGAIFQWHHPSMMSQILFMIQKTPGITTNEIIESVGDESASYLRKVLYQLREKKMVTSHKEGNNAAWHATGRIDTSTAT